MQEVDECLPNFDYNVTSHVGREANKVAYFLANWGCSHSGRSIEMAWPPKPLEDDLNPLNVNLEQDIKESQ